MSHLSGYGAYMLFIALKTHFTQEKYDFFKMNGKLRANKDSFMARKDRYFFDKIAKEYDTNRIKDFYIANLLEDVHYITNMLDDNAGLNYLKYMKRRQSLSYTFYQEINDLFDRHMKDCFKTRQHEYPAIINQFLCHEVSIETLVILDDFIGYTNKFDKYYKDDVIWPKISLKIRKYRPFLKYDTLKFKNILKEKIDGTGNTKR
jgi:hypothetical protein